MATSQTFWLRNVACEDEAQSTGVAFHVNPDGKTVDVWTTFGRGYEELERELCKRVSVEEAREIYREHTAKVCSYYGQLWVLEDNEPEHPGFRYAVARGVPADEAREAYYGAKREDVSWRQMARVSCEEFYGAARESA